MSSLRAQLGSWRRRAFSSDALALKVLRFGVIGVLSSGIFAAVTWWLVGPLQVDPKMASVVAYLASVPLNFLGNRYFSFRSSNALAGDFGRFALLHAGNIFLTAFAMGIVVDALGLHYAFGILGAVVLVPCVNFMAMNWWVFRHIKTRPASSNDASSDRLDEKWSGKYSSLSRKFRGEKAIERSLPNR